MACMFLLASSCQHESKKTQQKKPIPVSVVNISEASENKSIPFSGTIEALKTIDLGFMVSGKIQNIFVNEGDYVNKDQLIAELEPTDYQYALDAAQAQYERASSEYKRLEELYKKNSLTQSDFDKIKSDLKKATADYNYKKKQLNDTRLHAPIAGWISFDNTQAGEIVKQGIPIFQIIYTKEVYVKFMVPENELAIVESGDIIHLSIPAINLHDHAASIKHISPAANSYSRSFEVKAQLDNSDGHLKAGMIAHVEVASGDMQKFILIPARAVKYSANGEQYVYVIKDDKASKRNISTGGVSRTQIIVLEGLQPGESVVLSGIEKLYEGARVILTDNEK